MIGSHALITTIVTSVVLAFICGYGAKKLKLPTIIGYLFAGMLISPHTPGFVADQNLATQLAEIGIILLMFGVGLHFSVRDLIDVQKIAVPGAIFQMAVATCIGMTFAYCHDTDIIPAFVFGLALSVASTVVLLLALEERRALSTFIGRVSVGWLIVEDILMVLAIVLLPILASASVGHEHFEWSVALKKCIWALLKITVFIALMMIIARRVLPALFTTVAQTKSRELISLGTLAVALGFAYAAYEIFDASFALGAFLAGLVMNESKISRKAAEHSLPLRDTFSVLFFVSVGMLFDATILVREPMAVLVVLAIIVIGKSFAAMLIMQLFKRPFAYGILVAASLAQIGEFSFILAGMARSLKLMSGDHYDLIIAGALLSIALNPFVFKVADMFQKKAAA